MGAADGRAVTPPPRLPQRPSGRACLRRAARAIIRARFRGGLRRLHDSLEDWLAHAAPRKGPVALIAVEDEALVAETLHHHLDAGFAEVVALLPGPLRDMLPGALAARVTRVCHSVVTDLAIHDTLTRVTARAAPGPWLYWGYNAEFLFHPFRESRPVTEMLEFHEGERREAMLAALVDLYAPDLTAAPTGVTLTGAMLDRTGYHALGRRGADGQPRERQLDLYGGLRLRYAQHVAPERQRIDRIALWRARPDLRMTPDLLWSDPEYNTHACPWHRNLTAAVASFRAAKALKANAASTYDIADFRWHGSTPFAWHSRQLMELGLMEPGQWF